MHEMKSFTAVILCKIKTKFYSSYRMNTFLKSLQVQIRVAISVGNSRSSEEKDPVATCLVGGFDFCTKRHKQNGQILCVHDTKKAALNL